MGQKSAAKKTEARVSEWQSFGGGSSSQKKASQSYSYAPSTTSAEMTGWNVGMCTWGPHVLYDTYGCGYHDKLL